MILDRMASAGLSEKVNLSKDLIGLCSNERSGLGRCTRGGAHGEGVHTGSARGEVHAEGVYVPGKRAWFPPLSAV